MNIDPRLYFLMRRLKEVQAKYFFDQKICLLDIGYADGSFKYSLKTSYKYRKN